MTPISSGAVQVHPVLHRFVTEEALPGTGIDTDAFWRGFAALIEELTPENRRLLARRDELQAQIDEWHREHRGRFDVHRYRQFLTRIGYIGKEVSDCGIATTNVDHELCGVAGPQLVVPVDNARYALNAANARWGSLYDALYGTDVIGEENGASRTMAYNPVRGARVIDFVREFLDRYFPLSSGSHREVRQYGIASGVLLAKDGQGTVGTLRQAAALIGYRGPPESPTAILLRHHGLHVELHFDRSSPIGRAHAAGLCDVQLESAISTIQDCEDSVAAVDADDKVGVYRNWLGLMKGTLQVTFEKRGGPVSRRLNPDRWYTGLDGASVRLPGRSLMLVRNVGHFMMSDAVTLQGAPVPETLIDAAITALIAMHDLTGSGKLRNSRTGSVYIVKPKLHGPDEVALADRLFDRVEDILGLPRYTLKMGLMDEERRTSVNLQACIAAARHRVVFINTGFLDRTGDEIHTTIEAGPVIRKNDIRSAGWLDAYERRNVDIGLACGLGGHGQIGKGMWAMPDLMAAMLKAKIAHPLAGASTAWVPSPTAATLHALHYHEVGVEEVQRRLRDRAPASLDDILTPAVMDTAPWSAGEIQEELFNNAQSILGYVVRWIDLGIGCSKVPDHHGVALMEDRATLRISAQHVANWLHHGVCTADQVEEALRRMAEIVDAQNAADPRYRPMTPALDESIAFRTAHELIFRAREQPNGYTESILHARRRERKAQEG